MKKIANVDEVVNYIGNALGSTERDGFGYAIQGQNGVFGERTTTPLNFKTSFDVPVLEESFVEHNYNRFGTKTKPTGAGIFHGRVSTNDQTLVNTHPIIKNGWTLIHNGVVSNHGPKYEMDTTNDTEHMVHYLSTTGVKGIEENVTGYYAIASFDPIGQLHVLRDSIATLYVARIMFLDTLIFATTPRLIEDLCNKFQWRCSVISAMVDNRYLIFNDNKLVSESSITPRGRTAKENAWSSKSLGRDLFDDEHELISEQDILTEDEEKFLEEVNNYADHTYTFKDYDGEDLTFDQFQALGDNEKLYCLVIRSDGTVVDPRDHESERLWDQYTA
jgi:hypothetical protein